MRQIKFRAWDLNEKKMRMQGDGYCEDVYTWSKEYASKLMQFIGLKDKNGKEIYEGDIVKCKSFVLDNVWLFPVDDIRYLDRIAREEQDREVIGNIYENPELIE